MRNVLLGVTIAAALLLSVGCNQAPSGDTSAPPSPKALVAIATPQASTVPVISASPFSQASPVGTSSMAPANAPPPASTASPVGGTSSTTPVTGTAAEIDAVKKMQEATGLSFTIPAGAAVDVKGAGEIWFKCEPDLFVALQTVDDLDTAMKSGVARMKAIDQNAKVQKTREREQGGARARGTAGTLKVDGKEAQWAVLGFDAGKKVLRVVLIGKDIKNDASAMVLGNSIRKQAAR